MTWNANKGYVGSKMSERAVEAYNDGKKPLSKWLKSDIMDVLEQNGLTDKYNFRRINKTTLLSYFLSYSEYHHTGMYFSETDFYTINENKIKEFNDNEYKNLLELNSNNASRPKKESERKYCLATWAEWYGSRRHPRSEKVESYGYIDGDWFYYDDRKKKASGNWFVVIKYFDSEDAMNNEKEAKHQEEIRAMEELEAINREKQLKKEEKEYRKAVYKAYLTVYPDTSPQKFSRIMSNYETRQEAERILYKTKEYQRAELDKLLRARQKQLITREEFKAKQQEILNKYKQ